MARIKTYPTGTPAADDKILFTDVSDNDATKNATIGDLLGGEAAPHKYIYMYAAQNDTTTNVTTSYDDINMSTMDFVTNEGFELSEAGVITYTGETPQTFKVDGVIEFTGENNLTITVAMSIDNNEITQSAQSVKCAQTDPVVIVGIGVAALAPNSQLKFVVKGDSSATITLKSLNVVLTEL
jgi:hypothetical protein